MATKRRFSVCNSLGVLEGNILSRAYANPARLALNRVTACVGFRRRAPDFEVETVTIVVLPGVERLGLAGAGLLNLQGGQCHLSSPNLKLSG